MPQTRARVTGKSIHRCQFKTLLISSAAGQTVFAILSMTTFIHHRAFFVHFLRIFSIEEVISHTRSKMHKTDETELMKSTRPTITTPTYFNDADRTVTQRIRSIRYYWMCILIVLMVIT